MFAGIGGVVATWARLRLRRPASDAGSVTLSRSSAELVPAAGRASGVTVMAELTDDDPMSTTRYVYAKPGTRSESSKLFEEVVPIVLKRPAAPSVERCTWYEVPAPCHERWTAPTEAMALRLKPAAGGPRGCAARIVIVRSTCVV